MAKSKDLSGTLPTESYERNYWPVIAGWNRIVNGREYSRFLAIARRKPRRSFLGIPIADPLSRFANIWGSIATLIDLTYTAYIVPLSVAFNANAGADVNFYWVMDYIGSFIYVLDIIIEFHVGFMVRWDASQVTIRDGPSVAWNYFRHGTFWIDFIATLPVISQVAMSINASEGTGKTVLHALTLLKLLRLLRVFKVLNSMNKMDRGGSIFQWFFTHFNSITIFAANTFYSLMVVVNLIACLWWWIAVTRGLDNSWVVLVEATKPELDLETASDGVRWLVCVYFALVTMCTIGYGDIVATSASEIALVVIFIVSGIAYFGFLLSMITAMVATQSAEDPTSSVNLDKFHEMEMWLRRFEVSQHLRLSIRRFTVTGAKHGPSGRDAAFFKSLPLGLKIQVAQELQHDNLTALMGGAKAMEVLPSSTRETIAHLVAISSKPDDCISATKIDNVGVSNIIFLEEGEVGLFFPGSMRPIRVVAPAVLGTGALLTQGSGSSEKEPVVVAVTSVFFWRVDAGKLTHDMAKLAPQGLLLILEHYKQWVEQTLGELESSLKESPEVVGIEAVLAAYKEKLSVVIAELADVQARIKAEEEMERSRSIRQLRGYGSVQDLSFDLEGNSVEVAWETTTEALRQMSTYKSSKEDEGTLKEILAAAVLRKEGDSLFMG